MTICPAARQIVSNSLESFNACLRNPMPTGPNTEILNKHCCRIILILVLLLLSINVGKRREVKLVSYWMNNTIFLNSLDIHSRTWVNDELVINYYIGSNACQLFKVFFQTNSIETARLPFMLTTNQIIYLFICIFSVIGDEILKGQVQDSNSHFLCKKLFALGAKVKKVNLQTRTLLLPQN